MKPIISVGSAIILAIAAFGIGPVSEAAVQPLAAAEHGAAKPVFTQVSAGFASDCGLTKDGTIVCWGGNTTRQADPPSGRFIQVSAGGWSSHSEVPNAFGCGIKISKGVVCWGLELGKVPSGNFRQISAAAGADYVCGIKAGGSLACWGAGLIAKNPVTGNFVQVATGGDELGGYFGCAVRRNGRPACWEGDPNSVGISAWSVPAGQFTSVTVASYGNPAEDGAPLVCGRRKLSGKMVCWGNVPRGLVPVGTFTQVSASGDWFRNRESVRCRRLRAPGERADCVLVWQWVLDQNDGPARRVHSAQCRNA